LARELGLGELHVKDESARFGLNAFKALGASWAVHRYLARSGDRAITFTSATDGNHGRALTWTARQTGHRAIIYVPRHTVAARVNAIRDEGAEVIVVAGTYDDAVRRADEDSRVEGRQVISDTAYAGYTEIPEWVIEGYSTLFSELAAQMKTAPDIVIVQAGVGGLAAAAVRHFFGQNERPRPALICVQPVQADGLLESVSAEDGEAHAARGNLHTIMAGLSCGMPSLIAWPILKRGITLFLSIEDRFAAEAMRRFYASVEGDPRVISGESGAAGLAGLLALLGDPTFAEAREKLALSGKTVLVINSEGDTDPVNFQQIQSAGE
jgi:diaminopropionate ammonia-lyase